MFFLRFETNFGRTFRSLCFFCLMAFCLQKQECLHIGLPQRVKCVTSDLASLFSYTHTYTHPVLVHEEVRGLAGKHRPCETLCLRQKTVCSWIYDKDVVYILDLSRHILTCAVRVETLPFISLNVMRLAVVSRTLSIQHMITQESRNTPVLTIVMVSVR